MPRDNLIDWGEAEERISGTLKRLRPVHAKVPRGKVQIHFDASNQQSAIEKNPKTSNRLSMTRYTALTWAPLSLLYQFKRISNIYFLIITVLTYMPFSPKVRQSV